MKPQGPLTRPSADLSPKGEVVHGLDLATAHLSLGGEVAAQRRVRGPSLTIGVHS